LDTPDYPRFGMVGGLPYKVNSFYIPTYRTWQHENQNTCSFSTDLSYLRHEIPTLYSSHIHKI